MRNRRKNEVWSAEAEYFEYDNVYNVERDELRMDSASDTSVWYS